MYLLWVAFIGLIAGALARFVVPNQAPGGIIMTMALGVAGAFVANWLGGQMHWYGPDHPAGFIGATLGAIVILVVHHFVRSAFVK